MYYDTWGTPNTLLQIKPRADFLIELIQNLRSLTMAKWLRIEPSDLAHSIRIFFPFRNTPYKLDFNHWFNFYEKQIFT